MALTFLEILEGVLVNFSGPSSFSHSVQSFGKLGNQHFVLFVDNVKKRSGEQWFTDDTYF